MKKLIVAALSLSLLGAYAPLPASAEKATETISYTYDAGYWETKTREMEKLGRGLIAINTGEGVFLSWRLLDSEDNRFGSAKSNVLFNVYRNGTKITSSPLENVTNYLDEEIGTSYSVAPVVNGVEQAKCAAVSVQDENYFDIPLQKPADVTLNGTTASYSANDASCADLDGDGEYEIILKWDANGKDNSQSGYTGNVLLDAYKLNGTLLWRIDLGKNIRAGAHYTQFLVYDFDGDGYAEMTCQTSLGSKDNKGKYVTAASHDSAISSITDSDNENTDYRNSGGYILQNGSREEFLTIFDHEGNAVDTIYYPNQIVDVSVWGDGYGNRCDRFTATVAYMDGVNPYAVYMRGYYYGQSGYGQRQAACAVSFDGEKLSCTHSFDTFDANSYRSKSSSLSYSNGVYKGVDGYKQGYEVYVGEGNHNCTVADVDNDGRDEVITGALCYEFKDNELVPKWCTFREHGDALHIGDYDPTHEGFEFFTVHEDGWQYNYDDSTRKYYYKADTIKTLPDGSQLELDYGMTLIDPATGQEMYHKGVDKSSTSNPDTGRGVMANIGAGGFYQFSAVGTVVASGHDDYEMTGLSYGNNFRIFWDGDLYDEFLDGTSIQSWNKRTNRLEEILYTGETTGRKTGYGCVSINSTKANPALQADLFGDWREEVVYPLKDSSALRVFSTTTPTDYKIKTLMQDPVYRMGISAEQTAYNQPPHIGFYLSDELFLSSAASIKVTTPPDKASYAIGEELDLTGMVVTATLEDGSSYETNSYRVSGFNSSNPGTSTVTVSYMNKTAAFDVTIKSVSGITVTPPSKTSYAVGQSLNTAGMVVTASYTGSGTGEVPVSSCTITGFDSSSTGEKLVTVSYLGHSASFTVNVIEANLSLLNGTYETDSTSSVLTTIPIGDYDDSFSIEHTVTINQMPADGSPNDKNHEYGFYLRFMNYNNEKVAHTGSGWTLVQSGGRPQLFWKDTSGTTLGNLELGKTYTFRYDFTDVGSDTGAHVTLTVTDENGNTVISKPDLRLRNFTDTNTGKTAAINTIEIYNQARANSTASVTIGGARFVTQPIYNIGEIVLVQGVNVIVDMKSLDNVRIFAAKYSGGVLSRVVELVPEELGENVLNPGFSPDKVFMWTDDMYPLDYYEKAVAPSSYDVSVTVTDADGAPVPNAKVQLMEAQKDSEGGSDEDGSKIVLSSISLTSYTDENGVAEFTDVPSGQYRILAYYDSLGTTLQSVNLTSTTKQLSYSVKFKKKLN